MKTTKLLASALLFATVFGTAQAADTETLEAMKAQNGSVKTVLKYPYPKRKTASKYQHTVTFETNVEVINN